MERVFSRKDFRLYTSMKQILLDLEVSDKECWWLISDIEAYPRKKEYRDLIYTKEYVLLTTSELMSILHDEDFQWVWAVFSAIPLKYSCEDILKYDLPYIEIWGEGEYNPIMDSPKFQHPLAEIEIYAVDSTYMFIVTDNIELIERFKKSYPLFMTKYIDY